MSQREGFCFSIKIRGGHRICDDVSSMAFQNHKARIAASVSLTTSVSTVCMLAHASVILPRMMRSSFAAVRLDFHLLCIDFTSWLYFFARIRSEIRSNSSCYLRIIFEMVLAIFNFQSMLLVCLLLIVTCTLLKNSSVPILPGLIAANKTGFASIFHKFSVIGERLSPYVAIACLIMAIQTVFLE